MSRASAQTKETLSKSMSMRFPVLSSASGFLKFSKILNFNSRQTFVFCKFVHFQGVLPSTSCIFVFTIATIFARDSRQQYRFMHKKKYPLFNSQSERGFAFSYAILHVRVLCWSIFSVLPWCSCLPTQHWGLSLICRKINNNTIKNIVSRFN